MCSLPIPLQPAVYDDHHASQTNSFDVTGESPLPISLQVQPAVAEPALSEPAVAEEGVGNSDIYTSCF
jgi:hypothetical protein